MTRPNTDDGDGTAPTCELTAVDHATQSRRWARLVRDAGLSQERTPHGIRLLFRAEPDVERALRALVAIESECCSWARWRVLRDDGVIVLHASATGHGVQTLHEMLRLPQT